MTITKARGSVWSRADNSLSDADIKTHYEANLNTNEFDDVEKSKLASIAADAEKNMTKAELDALGIDAFSVNGVHASSGFSSDQTSVGVGAWSLYNSEANSADNTAVGVSSMLAMTTGNGNSGLGNASLSNCSTGWFNTAAGIEALHGLYSGISNVGIGDRAGYSAGANLSAGNFVVGVDYTISSSGDTDFTAIGAADNSVGTTFTATGAGSGTGTAYSNVSANTFVGYRAGYDVVSGSENTILGYGAYGTSAMQGVLQLGAGGVERLRVEDTGLYINGVQFTASGMTDAEVKIAYENNADTNEFSDGEEAKLAALKDLLPLANTWERAQSPTKLTLTDAATIDWDIEAGQSAEVTITANRAMGLPTNMTDSTAVLLVVKQDASGSRLLSYDAAFDFGDDGSPTLSTGANKVDVLTFMTVGTANLRFLGIKKGFSV